MSAKKKQSTSKTGQSSKKKTSSARPSKSAANGKPTLVATVVIGITLIVMFGALMLLANLNLIHLPALRLGDDSTSIRLSKKTGEAAPVSSGEAVKPDCLDPEVSMTDDEIRAEVERILQPVDADQYFDKIGTVIEKTPLGSAQNLATDADVTHLFQERGLVGNPIMTQFDLNGTRSDSHEIGGGSTRHPEYSTNYIDKSGRTWLIRYANGTICAQSLNYLVDHPDDPPLFLTEGSFLMGYDNVSNTFYRYTPDANYASLRVVAQITAAALDAYRY